MNKILIGIIVVLIIGMGGYFFMQKDSDSTYEAEHQEVMDEEMIPVEPDGGIGDGAQPLDELLQADADASKTVIGESSEGRDIVAYHFGEGEKEVLFIGGIHGGYSWNTAMVAQQLVAHLEGNEEVIPSDVKVTVIPVLNPDGLYDTVGTDGLFKKSDVPSDEAVRIAGRFNDNEVDLNRNFDCQWQETGTWKSQDVSGGSKPFSESESVAIRDYVKANTPDAVVAWYSSAGGVYASQCDSDTMASTLKLTNVYADASGYSAHEEFDFYEVTGDMVNWISSQGIPAISVLLTTHEDTEWKKNEAGINAVLKYIAN